MSKKNFFATGFTENPEKKIIHAAKDMKKQFK